MDQNGEDTKDTENVPVEETCRDGREIRGQKRPLDETLKTNEDDDEENFDGTFPPGVQAFCNGNTATVTFESIEPRICLIGRARLKCLDGAMQILGHSLKSCDDGDDKDPVVTSPFWSSWATFQAETVPTKIQLTSIRGTPSFRLVSPTRPTIIPPSWRTTVDQLVEEFSQPRAYSTRDSLEEDSTFQHPKQQILICGAKSVGKSTFLRYMTNRFLSSQIDQVAILDADVGQPECAPPGVIQLSLQQKPLLQPPYLNLLQPNKIIASTFYGSVTSKVDPTRYMEAVQSMITQYKEYVSKSQTPIPLIINMDGWIRGVGYQILSALITNIEPSHVCQVLGESKSQIFELSEVIPKEGTTLFFLEACTKLGVIPRHIPSSTLRTLRMATYFGPHLAKLWDTLDFLPAKQLQTGWVDKHCTLAQHLAQERPYCVPFESVRYWFIGSDRQDLVKEHQVLQAMHGSIVALCNSTQNCLGLGLVRAIDWKSRLFYVVTPANEGDLTSITNLVGGNLPLPIPFYFRGVYAESFPYLTMPVVSDASSKVALGSEPMKSRNNIGRRSLVGPSGTADASK